MNATLDLAEIIASLLKAPGALRVDLPVLVRKKKDPANEIQSAIAQHQLCIFVLPPFPTSALQGLDLVFYDKAELRIRIIEQVKLNRLPATAYDLSDDIATALHWQPVTGIKKAMELAMAADDALSQAEALALVKDAPANAALFALQATLAQPLQIDPHPVEQVEDANTRILDVIFNATYELNPA